MASAAAAKSPALVNFPYLHSSPLCSNHRICGLGIKAFCCPCVVYGQNKKRYSHLANQGVPDPEDGGGCCSGPCWLHCCITSFFGVGWILQVSTCPLRFAMGSNGYVFTDGIERRHSFAISHQRRGMWGLLHGVLLPYLRFDSEQQGDRSRRAKHGSSALRSFAFPDRFNLLYLWGSPAVLLCRFFGVYFWLYPNRLPVNALARSAERSSHGNRI